ncbi:diguanylate cyclase [uncultured Desulfuromonas sp.]|uniref:GGDEF domain-containing response regulator n=1 Tax=uncultured Desulfuromonas sp. TaxID=181013 RepID=UPI002AAA67B5|nr:diguanylate cyclase [uncultured Desulfuromonas sp.]
MISRMCMDQQQKILIVDDEKVNLRILRDILQAEAAVILAKDGAQAIRKATQFHPDLILLDVMMPDRSGFEVLGELKSDAATGRIPVIFVTALSDVENEKKGLKLGACDYIYKPFDAEIVKARIDLHLQLVRQRKMLEELANIDALTSIANRRKYEEVFEMEWRIALRSGKSLSVVMVDIDCFKQFNDLYGHAAGDAALKQVARTLSANLKRPGDFVARYGGEEFVVLLPDTGLDGSLHIMQTCRQAIEALRIEHGNSNAAPVLTISAGAYTLVPKEQDDRQAVLKRADDMLYRAKQQGKNTIICSCAEG